MQEPTQDGENRHYDQNVVRQGNDGAGAVAEGVGQLMEGPGDIKQNTDGSHHHSDGSTPCPLLGDGPGNKLRAGFANRA
ncbi:MAG: hypothetical protein DDT26_01346 [Dehalococcoidia bacterium]|nr:hypothetical protein [Chloroflexota bacterium]